MDQPAFREGLSPTDTHKHTPSWPACCLPPGTRNFQPGFPTSRSQHQPRVLLLEEASVWQGLCPLLDNASLSPSLSSLALHQPQPDSPTFVRVNLDAVWSSCSVLLTPGTSSPPVHVALGGVERLHWPDLHCFLPSSTPGCCPTFSLLSPQILISPPPIRPRTFLSRLMR